MQCSVCAAAERGPAVVPQSGADFESAALEGLQQFREALARTPMTPPYPLEVRAPGAAPPCEH
jgi:hypothetical protein